MHFAKFYIMNTSHQIVEKLGSDGVCILDGRNSYTIKVINARDIALRLNRNLNSGIIGLTIHKGETFTRSHQIGGYSPIKK